MGVCACVFYLINTVIEAAAQCFKMQIHLTPRFFNKAQRPSTRCLSTSCLPSCLQMVGSNLAIVGLNVRAYDSHSFLHPSKPSQIFE